MADPTSYIELLEQSQQLEYLINSNCISEEEKEELEVAWNFITSRSESKFDCIIGVIKECDKCIDQSAKEIKELKENQEFWKKKRSRIINIIKFAYQTSSKPTGNKYQATIKSVRSKLIPNFEKWSEEEKNQFGLEKNVTVKRICDEEVIKEISEILPDKERLRETMEEAPLDGPSSTNIVKRVSLGYRLRKRLKRGI
jgi:hypothetical protein